MPRDRGGAAAAASIPLSLPPHLNQEDGGDDKKSFM